MPPVPRVAEREWTNAEGNTMRGALLRIEGRSGVFAINGHEVPYELAKLAAGDQELVRKAMSADQ